MSDGEQPSSLVEVLDRLEEAAREQSDIALGAILEAVGRRSFGPLLLVAGLIALSPLSGIPGMPTTVGVLVLIIAVQLLARRDCFWLPQWIVKRTVSHDKLIKGVSWGRPVARFIDRLMRPRLTALTEGAGAYLIAVVSVMIAVTMPPLELLPFAATLAGAALATFGLSLIAHDGVVGLMALAFTAFAVGLAATHLLG